ncbi:MAG TPA: transposase [Ktedonobacterales bacterium]|nr:transposase [Ktedonobacterales bacterium]
MHLVEQHRIDRHDPRWRAIDAAAFASKNLYNSALYVTRQAYILQGNQVIRGTELDRLMQGTVEYRALPAKVAQWVLKQVCTAWDSYFAAVAAWQQHPDTFLGHPKLPRYLNKQGGRNLLVYTAQAISHAPQNAGWVVPSGLSIRVATKHQHVDIGQVRIVPKATHYVVEVIYEREPEQHLVDPTLIASIDVGVNTLAAITSNKPGFVPLLVNGRPLKSLNQSYNKRHAQQQACLPEDQFTSRALDHLTDRRTRAITSYLHTASRAIINLLVREGIGTLVIGKNVGWKQRVGMGKKNNQAFVFLPHARFIQMLTYKAELVGIRVVLTEESYTSKASFLDGDELPVYGAADHADHAGHEADNAVNGPSMPTKTTRLFSGKRVKRGLYRTANGCAINADVNGSYNILRKAFPNAFVQSMSQLKIHPVQLLLPDRQQDRRKQSRTPHMQATG